MKLCTKCGESPALENETQTCQGCENKALDALVVAAVRGIDPFKELGGVMRLNPLKATQEKIEMLEYQISRTPEVMIQGTGNPVKATKVLEILRMVRALELADELPLTQEEAEKEYAEAPEVPLTKDEIEDIVKKVTDP